MGVNLMHRRSAICVKGPSNQSCLHL